MRPDRGFSLIEMLVATTIVAVGATSLAHLFVMAIGANARAKEATRATVFAQHKMEELRAEPELIPSPPDALNRNAPGYHDFSDNKEAPLVRRWSVEPLPGDPERTFVLQVRVVAAARGSSAAVHLTSVARRGS